jgi:hypothetical protein
MRAEWIITQKQLDDAKDWTEKFYPAKSYRDGSIRDRFIGRLGETSVQMWLKLQRAKVVEGPKFQHDLIAQSSCGVKRIEVKSKWINGWPGGILNVNVRADQLTYQKNDTDYYVFTFIHPCQNTDDLPTETWQCTIVGMESPTHIPVLWTLVKEGDKLQFNDTVSRYDMYVQRNEKLQSVKYLAAYLR